MLISGAINSSPPPHHPLRAKGKFLMQNRQWCMERWTINGKKSISFSNENINVFNRLVCGATGMDWVRNECIRWSLGVTNVAGKREGTGWNELKMSNKEIMTCGREGRWNNSREKSEKGWAERLLGKVMRASGANKIWFGIGIDEGT